MDITWLKSLAEGWHARRSANRVPHALMLAGQPGVGKRAAAAWIAAEQLGLANGKTLPQYPAVTPEHADLHWIRPPDDKQAIGIEQIRSLVAELNLTSYAGGGKVAIIEPANRMTANAANSLLKTLEEPPGDALLILIVDRIGKLPATIFSRCQRIDILQPETSESLAWLDRLAPGTAWAEALRLAGNAPLIAVESIEQLDLQTSMRRDFAAVAAGQASALHIAGQWAKLEPGFVLDWMARQIQAVIQHAFSPAKSLDVVPIQESVLERMDRRNLFCYLDIINRYRGQPSGSYNVQLTLESLLIDLAEGLQSCGQNAAFDGLQALQAES